MCQELKDTPAKSNTLATRWFVTELLFFEWQTTFLPPLVRSKKILLQEEIGDVCSGA
eukprot:m.283616 g.283616  ORF g.283616 m.283616 type:complete len:57 (+) comp19418_c0_seq15:448-618(+)